MYIKTEKVNVNLNVNKNENENEIKLIRRQNVEFDQLFWTAQKFRYSELSYEWFQLNRSMDIK